MSSMEAESRGLQAIIENPNLNIQSHTEYTYICLIMLTSTYCNIAATI